MRAQAQVLLEAVKHAPCAILVANTFGRYVSVNEAASALTGYSRPELLRRSVWDVTPPPRVGIGRIMWRAFLERRRMRGTYVIRRKDGTHVRARYVAIANVVRGLHVSALSAIRKTIAGRRIQPQRGINTR